MTMPLNNKKILVIDDTVAIRTFLRISFMAQGANIYEAGTAKEGIAQFISGLPDVVILDLGLPDKDGLEVLPELRQYAAAHNHACTIIILSVRKDQQTIDTALIRGANAYLTKPFLVENLIELLHTQCG